MTDFDPFLDPPAHRPPDGGCLGALLSLSAGGFFYTALVAAAPLVSVVTVAVAGGTSLELLRRRLERRSTPPDPTVARLAHLGGGRRP